MPRRAKVGVVSQAPSTDSDFEDEKSSQLLPSEAFQQLLGALEAESSKAAKERKRPSKRQKISVSDLKQPPDVRSKHLDPGVQDLPQRGGALPQAQLAKCSAVAKEGTSETRQQPGENGRKRGKGSCPAEDRLGSSKEDALESAESEAALKKHTDRQLTEAEIVELRSSKLAKDSSAAFASAWANGSWWTSGDPLPEVHDRLADAGVRPRLARLWRESNGGLGEESDFLSAQQQAFFGLARSYKDILYPAKPYPQSVEEVDEICDAALLHCIDHVIASSLRIKRANEKSKADPGWDPPRDQGFTRPKVLILLPMRNAALRLVKRLLQLAQKETRADSIQGKARFLEEFGDEESAAASDDKPSTSPPEHAALFAGDTDDHFRFGIKVTKGAIKLYADFYQSDIIVASPIGLVTKQAEGADESAETMDFLSSIEIVLVPRCDVLLMQNWAHMVTVFEALNKMPKETHGADIMRVYDWSLEGRAPFYRQNILLASFVSPEMKSLFSRHCCSHAGKAKLQLTHKGVLGRSKMQLQQVFEKFDSTTPTEEADARFQHFKDRVWPRIRDSGSGGQFIFVPSYFDYVRLRGFFAAESVGFEGLSEYAPGSEVARGKRRFTTGQTRIALYTERSHFYHRRKTKGVKDLFVYQLPEHAHFYAELLDLAASADGIVAGHATVTVLFSHLDALRLERVVGSSRARGMLKASTSTFLFC